ncbi:MAG: DNA polymerase III subunit delta' [Gammaproteobacteria bacterium]|nr:DNA polymerase III subunit delta' [Gammaproteobacteria bacterium]MCP5196025.1 DNA polymerase III subunit delta' [Gammaproteobacteria bacterium]
MHNERLPWHDEQWRQLQQRRVAGGLPHALLLTGQVGLGKGLFARRLARGLLCASPDSEGDACGQCQACRLFQAGSHPDYREICPEEAYKNTENDSLEKKSKVIKIDQVRDFCVFLSYTAQHGGYKIVLLEPADRLHVNAANSLLKTLEEPPGDSLLLLVTSQPARLPATVRSRCQMMRFKLPPTEVVIPWLAAQLPDGLSPSVLLEVAGGAPLTALTYADTERWRRRQLLVDSYERIMTGQLDPIQAAENWIKGDLAENLRWLIGWHTDLIRLKMNPDSPRLGNSDLRLVLQGWVARKSLRTLFERLDAAIQLHALCTTTQVNAQLLLEVFLSDDTGGHPSGAL